MRHLNPRSIFALLLVGSSLSGAACGDDGNGANGILPTGDGGSPEVTFGGDAATGPDAATDPGASDEPGAAADPGAAVDLGGPSDPGASVDPGPAPDPGQPPDVGDGPSTLGGGILVSELDSALLNRAGAGARFTDPTADPTGQVFGDCLVAASDPNASADGFGYDAGAITVGGTTPAVTLTPVNEGAKGTGYTSGLVEEQVDLLPAGGALMTFSGAGGAHVGAFTLVVQAPEPVVVSAPVTGFGESAPQSQDLSITWNSGTGERILVSLSPLDGSFQPTAGPAIACVFEGDSGAAVVPAGALAALSNTTHALGVTRVRTGSSDVDGLTVTATVTRSSGGLLTLE